MTFTVLARDPRFGLVGAATASKSLAVGNAVIAVRPGVGAVASQAWTIHSLRGRMLDELAVGRSAAEAVGMVTEWDEQPELRQIAALGVTGVPAARSGADLTPWAGDAAGEHWVVAGNLLAGETVLAAMMAVAERMPPVEAPESAAVTFARHLVDVLAAADAEGGDARGRQSAAVLVATSGEGGETSVDLRVDDHSDPVAELARLVSVRAADLRGQFSARRA